MSQVQVAPFHQLKRQANLDAIHQIDEWDMVVIGGGITGAGVVREAARQGMRVLLLEQKDFSWGTSSRSSKMVHGGLRYLASGNLKLTSHSVKERERLLQEAPGLIDILPFSWLHYKGKFPGPFIFNSLLALYDLMAGKRYRHFLSKSEAQYQLLNIDTDNLLGATCFADAVTDDSRLVLRVLKEAEQDGAVLLNYAAATDVIKTDGHIGSLKLKLENERDEIIIKAKVIVSATGAWADKFRQDLGEKAKIRPLRGSHLVLPSWRLPMAQSITMKHPVDGRSMFVYPWEGMTVIGTTDLDNPVVTCVEPVIQEHEVEYLIEAANSLFPSSSISSEDIISSWAGVRPIVSNGGLNPSAEKRDHSIWDDQGLITVSGGKLTTFRLIALDVLKAASKYLPKLNWKDNKQQIFRQASSVPKEIKGLDFEVQKRLLGFYGTQIQSLCDCVGQEAWALVPGTKTYWVQVRYAARYEQAIHLDDILLRRTRVGLFCKGGGSGYKNIIKQICMTEMQWSEGQWNQEWDRYINIWNTSYSLPASAVKRPWLSNE
jgi:glycerol-3-phosphate dehydrogenase